MLRFYGSGSNRRGCSAAGSRTLCGGFGTVDILVNCAGMHLSAEVTKFDRSKWDPMIQLNLTAAFEMSHEAAKVMLSQKSGKIINICSLFSFWVDSNHQQMLQQSMD